MNDKVQFADLAAAEMEGATDDLRRAIARQVSPGLVLPPITRRTRARWWVKDKARAARTRVALGVAPWLYEDPY